jgi:hypothetical protein
MRARATVAKAGNWFFLLVSLTAGSIKPTVSCPIFVVVLQKQKFLHLPPSCKLLSLQSSQLTLL